MASHHGPTSRFGLGHAGAMVAVSFVESAGSGGHLLVVQGDLTALAVDAIVVPCDSDGNAHHDFGPLLTEAGVDLGQTTFLEGFVKVGPNEGQVDQVAGLVRLRNAGQRQVWMLDTTVTTRGDVAALVAAVASAVDRISEGLVPGSTVALPLPGVNAGGFEDSYFPVITELIPALEKRAAKHDLDVVLVTRARADYAAVQHFRRDQLTPAGASAGGSGQVLTRLAGLAREGQLVPFLGAGASMGAGAPSWWALLQSLARDAGIGDDELPALQELDARDAAMVIARRSKASPDGANPARVPSMEERYKQIRKRITEEVDGDLYTVTQGLIAGLALPEAVTTNYDRQYELANTATAGGATDPAEFAVVPQVRPQSGSPWVLKIHGDVATPKSIVISRDDYLRFDREAGPAAGMLQSRMLTGHLLFVGYSMSDENIVRLARDVQRYREAFAAADAKAPVGTVLELVPNPLRHQLWDGTLDFVTFGVARAAGVEAEDQGGGSPAAPRRLRVFLDRLAMLACDDVPYLLDAKYRDLVVGGESGEGGSGESDGAVARMLGELSALGVAADAIRDDSGVVSSAARVAANRVQDLLAEFGRGRATRQVHSVDRSQREGVLSAVSMMQDGARGAEMPDQGDVIDRRPRVWADAFPWLPSTAGGFEWEDEAWWNWSIDDTVEADRNKVLSAIVFLAVDRMGKWSIGDVCPGLPGDLELANLDLSNRAVTALHREQRFTTADLLDLPVEELLAFRNTGVVTATSVLRRLADLSTVLPQATIGVEYQAPEVVDEPSSPLGTLLSDLEILAAWNHSIGQASRGVLADLPPGAPEAVTFARRRLFELSAAEVIPSSGADVAELLNTSICGMDERFRMVLAERLFAWEPKTLDELGREFGVTRERVRQLEVKAKSKLAEFVSGDNPVASVAALVRSEIHSVRPLRELLAIAPALAQNVESVGQPAWRVIDVLDESYEIADGWCAQPSFEAVRRDTSVVLDELADEYGVVLLAEIPVQASDLAGSNLWLTEWLAYLGYEFREQYVLLRISSVADIAAAVLSIEGAPLKLDEIHRRVGRGTQDSLRNQLYSDPAFHRIDREQWVLTSWGMEAYTNIRGEIGKLLDQAGGELPLATIVESLANRFGVSANSVTIYAGSAPYQVRNGIVREGTRDHASRGRNPAKVQGYYRRGDDWIFRTTVTRDHLRGSGWPASTALAAILGMSPGEYAELPSRLGNQRFSYVSPQPTFGSIKRFLEDIDLGIGDEIFLVFTAGGTFDVEQLPEPSSEPMAEALRLVGADMTLPIEQALETLGAAINFEPGSDAVSIAAGYRARGEQRIHDLILGAGRN